MNMYYIDRQSGTYTDCGYLHQYPVNDGPEGKQLISFE